VVPSRSSSSGYRGASWGGRRGPSCSLSSYPRPGGSDPREYGRGDAFLALCLAPAIPAGLLRIELSERSDVLAGKAFGAAGPYERLVGKAYFGVDPKLPANKIICDIDKAPRNDSGLVEFSSDIYVLKPRDPKNGNGAVLYEVSNRGGKGMLAMYNRAKSSADPRTADELGDNFLLERGYTLIWLGWQFDVPRVEGRMRLYTPIARNGDQPITGLVRSEIIVDKKEFSHSLADRNHIPYQPIDPNDSTLALTVRERNDGPRRSVPRNAWKIVEGTHLAMDAGFEPAKTNLARATELATLERAAS